MYLQICCNLHIVREGSRQMILLLPLLDRFSEVIVGTVLPLHLSHGMSTQKAITPCDFLALL
jgi:hypothetical protein